MDLYRIINFVLCLVIHCTDVENNEPTREVTSRLPIEINVLNVTATPVIEATTTTTAATTATTTTTTTAAAATTTTTTAATTSTLLPSFNETVDDANVADNELEMTNDIRKRRGVEIQQEDMLRSSAAEMAPPKGNGALCQFNQDCISGCCLAATGEERRCSSLAARGDQCEIAQIKGGFYAGFCPCSAGDGACSGAAKGQRQQRFCTQ